MASEDTKERRDGQAHGRIWFIDTEGNGSRAGEIVELAAVETVDLRPTGLMRSWRVKPSEPIDWKATRVHGIRNADVAGCPSIDDVAEEIRGLLGSDPVVGQAVREELDMMAGPLRGWRPRAAIDTHVLARELVPGLQSYRLSRMTEELGLRGRIDAAAGGSAHGALNDAMACAVLVEHLRGISDPDAFDRAFAAADSLVQWDTIVRRRKEKAQRASERHRAKEERRAAQRALEEHVRKHGSNRSRAREARAAYQEGERRRSGAAAQPPKETCPPPKP